MHPQSMYPPSHFADCSMHRKSRIVGVVEELHRSVDDHCVERFGVIQAAKERRAYEIKQKARYAFRTPSCCFPAAPHIRCVAWLHPRVDLDYPRYMHTFLCCSTHCIRCRCISCTGSRSRRSQATILRGQSTGQCPQPIQHSECICRHGCWIYRADRRLCGC